MSTATGGGGFDPKHYWNQRHARTCGLEGVGFLGLGAYNDWMYRLRADVFRRVLRGAQVQGARVLDVGCGTGFYLDLWRALGAREIVGVDLSEVAVERLRADDPALDLRVLDIASAPEADLAALGTFDFVSVIDVLYHVVDDAAYARAFRALARLLSAGGRLIFTENFLREAPRRSSAWHVSRTATETEAALAASGLEIERRVPCFVLMNTPVDSTSRVLQLEWRLVEKIARRSRLAGGLLGAATYPVERLLTKILRESPSSELAVARRSLQPGPEG
ncbi:MAG: class I SAM-dependent methyltransferase [Deltaproteobacteria bacterium]|nr:class I SAM-dependent methyltransferase [Deltaproteobacteria bacterium]